MIAKRPGLAALTGIRGTGAVIVMLYHILQGLAVHLGVKGTLDFYFIRDGFRAVDMFFILSGFILMYRHERDFRVVTREGVRLFATGRFFRIYPVNTLVLLLTLGMVLACPGYVHWVRDADPRAFSSPGFFQTLLLANRWLLPDFGEWNGPTWSLSLELLGYMAFPWICARIGRVKSRNACIAIAIVAFAILLAGGWATGTENANRIGRIAFMRMGTCFVAGVALCRVRVLTPDDGGAWPQRLTAISTIALFVVLAFEQTRALASFALGGMIFGLSYQRGRVDRFFSDRINLFLGEISFPFYLLHSTMLEMVFWMYTAHILPQRYDVLAAVIVLYVAVVIGLATLIHRHVELPAQQLGRRIIKRRDKRLA